ncbi:MAG: ParB/RepB/Spo0J family partition protein [Clostridiales Family XIII bacterium]|jgi:ParB family chromosome partitioning protein|nr:ParB/RepB/Spo0J family partition protein [Clostridiales Family XIII bacterium]
MTGKKKALGRGLDALFGDIEVAVPARGSGGKSQGGGAKAGKNGGGTASEEAENAVLYIDIDNIRPNEMQPRQSFEPEAIEALAASIETYGVIQPVLLKKTKLGYELIAGERRWRAARKAGLKEIPAILREVTGEENALIAIIENMQRENLNPIEEAGAYRMVLDKYDLTQEQVARAVGKSRSHVANTLRVLKFPEELLEYMRVGLLSLGHANAIGALRDPALQLSTAQRIVKNGLTVRESEKLCAQIAEERGGNGKKKPSARKAARKGEEIRRVEEDLTSLVGTKVVISGDANSGSVELRYFERTGLDEIVEFLRKAGERRR